MGFPGFKNFSTGAVLTEADMDGIVRQTVMPFADVATRDSELSGVLQESMFCMTQDADTLWHYDGSEWQAFMASEPTAVTPSWNNLTVGAATQVADIQNVGSKQLRYKGQITLAADSSIGGSFTLDIPESLTSIGTPCRGIAIYNDTGTRIYQGTVGVAPSSTVIAFTHGESGNGGLANATAPFTFGTGDVIAWDITIGVA